MLKSIEVAAIQNMYNSYVNGNNMLIEATDNKRLTLKEITDIVDSVNRRCFYEASQTMYSHTAMIVGHEVAKEWIKECTQIHFVLVVSDGWAKIELSPSLSYMNSLLTRDGGITAILTELRFD